MATKPTTTESRQRAPGVIEPGSLYTLSEFSARTGLGEWALRQARRKGLRMVRVGSAKFILGADFVAYINRVNGTTTDTQSQHAGPREPGSTQESNGG